MCFWLRGKIPWPPASKHWLPERKRKNPNLNKNLQLLRDPCSGPSPPEPQEGVVFYPPVKPASLFLLQIPFYRQNSFSISLRFYVPLWAACNILVWGSKTRIWRRAGKMQGEFLQMSGWVVPRQLGLKPCRRGGALLWRRRMWAQPHLVSFNARSKGPELLHSFSMSYIKSDY